MDPHTACHFCHLIQWFCICVQLKNTYPHLWWSYSVIVNFQIDHADTNVSPSRYDLNTFFWPGMSSPVPKVNITSWSQRAQHVSILGDGPTQGEDMVVPAKHQPIYDNWVVVSTYPSEKKYSYGYIAIYNIYIYILYNCIIHIYIYI